MKYYTPEQAAAEIGVVPRTLAEWRRTGKFIPVKTTPGGHSRYSQEQIDSLNTKPAQKEGSDLEDMM